MLEALAYQGFFFLFSGSDHESVHLLSKNSPPEPVWDSGHGLFTQSGDLLDRCFTPTDARSSCIHGIHRRIWPQDSAPPA